MRIGVIGLGVVGKAVAQGLTKKGHEVFANDPQYIIGDTINFVSAEECDKIEITSKKQIVKECEVIFICVGTPPLPRDHPSGFGACDLSTVYQVFNECWEAWGELSTEPDGVHSPTYVIKSTVLPGTVDALSEIYPLVCSNPEFLTERNALQDFLHPDRIIIGTQKEEVIKKMEKVYEDFDYALTIMEPKEAELVKYLSNAFLVAKVGFAMEMAAIAELLNVDAEKVAAGVGLDKRIGPSHLFPEPGKIPFYTPCLAKDTLALIKQLDKSGLNTSYLKSVYKAGVFTHAETLKDALAEDFSKEGFPTLLQRANFFRRLKNVKEDWE